MKKLSRDQTFMLITVPVLVLFFCFNTLPLIKGLIYSFTAWVDPTCSPSNSPYSLPSSPM